MLISKHQISYPWRCLHRSDGEPGYIKATVLKHFIEFLMDVFFLTHYRRCNGIIVSVLDSGLSISIQALTRDIIMFSLARNVTLSASDSQPRCIKLLGTSEFNAGAVTQWWTSIPPFHPFRVGRSTPSRFVLHWSLCNCQPDERLGLYVHFFFLIPLNFLWPLSTFIRENWQKVDRADHWEYSKR